MVQTKLFLNLCLAKFFKTVVLQKRSCSSINIAMKQFITSTLYRRFIFSSRINRANNQLLFEYAYKLLIQKLIFLTSY